ncbi:hypothetical protein [Limnobacter litoralis]|nr:hypothetical protein [Limnobacter litoralis]
MRHSIRSKFLMLGALFVLLVAFLTWDIVGQNLSNSRTTSNMLAGLDEIAKMTEGNNHSTRRLDTLVNDLTDISKSMSSHLSCYVV